MDNTQNTLNTSKINSIEEITSYLSGMTVKNIKDSATAFGIKCPSMNKNELVGWLSGVIYSRQFGEDTTKGFGYKVEFSRVVGLDVSKPREDRGWLQSLRDNGVVSIKIEDFNPEEYKKNFWGWLSMCNPEVREDNKSSWSLDKVPPSTRGIFKNYIGHQEWMWTGREKCHSIFKDIWGTDNLLSSFDGASVIFPPIVKESSHHLSPPSGLTPPRLGPLSPPSGLTPPRLGPLSLVPLSLPPTTFKNWFHYDQGRFSFDLSSIQGVVHLTDTNDDDGGFCFIENSHLLHTKYAETHLSWGYKWEVIDIDHPTFSTCRLIKPRVKAGEILLFDSRIAHCFVPSRSNNYRMVMYVCMMPRQGANQKEIEKRQKLYVENSMTGHWCYGPWFDKTDAPYTPGRVQIKPPLFSPPVEGLSQLRLSMIGV